MSSGGGGGDFSDMIYTLSHPKTPQEIYLPSPRTEAFASEIDECSLCLASYLSIYVERLVVAVIPFAGSGWLDRDLYICVCVPFQSKVLKPCPCSPRS